MTDKPNLTKVWAGSAPIGNVVDPDIATAGKFEQGWIAEIPDFEHFNYLLNNMSQALAHINEHGIPRWDSATSYPIGAWVMDDNKKIYVSFTTSIGEDPSTSPGSWRLFYDEIPKANTFIYGLVKTSTSGTGNASDIAASESLANTKVSKTANSVVSGTIRVVDGVPVQFGGDGGGVDSQIFYDDTKNSFVIGLKVGTGFEFGEVGNSIVKYNGSAVVEFDKADIVVKDDSAGNSRVQLQPEDDNNTTARFLLGAPAVPARIESTSYFGVEYGASGLNNTKLEMRRQNAVGVNTNYITVLRDQTIEAALSWNGSWYANNYFDIIDLTTTINVEVLTDATLAKGVINSLVPVKFDRPPLLGGDNDRFGFLAEDIQTVLPSLVTVTDNGDRTVLDLDVHGNPQFETPEDELNDRPMFKTINNGDVTLGVDTTGLIPHMVVVLKSLLATVDAQQIQIDSLQSQIDLL